MATFEITDRAQMRRCRRAQLHGLMLNEPVESCLENFPNESFEACSESIFISGYVLAIRPHLMASSPRWTVTVADEKAVPKRTQAGDRIRGIYSSPAPAWSLNSSASRT